MSIKEKYFIEKISRLSAKQLLDKYHYLHENGNFRSGINFGLFSKENSSLIGVCVFHTVSAKEIAKGCFGLNTFKLEGFYELGRLCINPYFFEKNITSFFLGNSIKLLRKIKQISALLTYADVGYHVGYIYQACNFKYYGLTSPKNDFFINDGSVNGKKLQRGKCKHLDGEWRPKNQKHRYMIIFDKSLKTLWDEMEYPKGDQKSSFNFEKPTKEKEIFITMESQPKLF